MRFLLLTLIFILPITVNAKPYEIDYNDSKVTFSGEHAGDKFEGVFEKWNAQIDFDKDNLSKSTITATFDTAYALTGNTMYDGTLPEDDWFAIDKYPTATFKSNSITSNVEGSFTIKGDLNIRDITKPIEFVFALVEKDGKVLANAEMLVDRLSYDIGKKSDAEAEWVSKEIKINLSIVATEKQ